VTADNKSKYLGDPDPTFTFTYGPFQGSDTSTVIDTAPTCGVSVAHTAVGNYPIACSGGSDNNYEFSYVGGTLSITYKWTGFFKPVDNPSVFNVVKAGQAIPMKFNLGGNQGLNIFRSGYPLSARVPCEATSPTDLIEETVTAGGSSLTYDSLANQYIYVWKTDKGWAGTCRVFDLGLNDNTTHLAYFKFTK
jgi:hypothetical protein